MMKTASYIFFLITLQKRTYDTALENTFKFRAIVMGINTVMNTDGKPFSIALPTIMETDIKA